METMYLSGSQELTDIEQFMMKAALGSALCGVTRRPEPHVDWFLKEATSTIRGRIREPYDIEARTGLFERDGVLLVPTIFKMAPDLTDLFESWPNVHAPFKVGDLPSILAAQDSVAVHLYGDGFCREASIVLDNFHRELFSRVKVQVDAHRAWSMREFDRARAKLQQEYSSPQILWDAMADARTVFRGRRVRVEVRSNIRGK